MVKSSFTFPLFSIILAIGFLWVTDLSIHNNFKCIEAEVREVEKKISKTEEQKLWHLNEISKKKHSYSNLTDNYLELKKAALSDKESDLILQKIYKTDESKLDKLLIPYEQFSNVSESPKLSKLYTQMALSQYLQNMIDSLAINKNLAYNSELVTMNEPLSYHVGKQYPIYFDVVNTVVDSQFDVLSIKSNDEIISPSKFPLVYSHPQKLKEFKVSPLKNKITFFHTTLHTKNHELTP